MQSNDQLLNSKVQKIGPKSASIMAAVSLGVLLALSFQRFELRSISGFILQSSALSIALWFGLYFIFYRKLSGPIRFDIKVVLIAIISSVFFGIQITPPQTINTNYVFMAAITSLMFFLFFLSFLLALLNDEKINPKIIFTSFAFLLGFIGMLIVIYNTFSVRMYSDDFCNAVQLGKMGFWKSVKWYYNTWSARFFSNFLVIGLSRQTLAPFFLSILVILSIYLSTLKVVKSVALEKYLSSLACAFFIPFAIFTVTPDLYKSLYWVSSTLILLPLLIMIPVYLVIINHYLSTNQHGFQWMLMAGVLLSFAIATTHEVASLGWFGLHCIGFIWHYAVGSKNIGVRNYLLSGLLGTSIGLLVLLISPGVDARVASQSFPPPPSIKQTLLLTTTDVFNFIKRISLPIYQFHGESRPGWFLIIAAAGLGWIVNTPIRRHLFTAIVVLATIIAMVAVSFFPGEYITSSTIPLRTQFIPSLYLVFGVFIFGICLPRGGNKLFMDSLSILLMVVMIFGSYRSIRQLMLTIDPIRQFAREWDLRDETIRATSELPQRIQDVPWEKYEQGFDCFRFYYQTIK